MFCLQKKVLSSVWNIHRFTYKRVSVKCFEFLPITDEIRQCVCVCVCVYSICLRVESAKNSNR